MGWFPLQSTVPFRQLLVLRRAESTGSIAPALTGDAAGASNAWASAGSRPTGGFVATVLQTTMAPLFGPASDARIPN
ncbi:hypothetical protein ABH37_12005 [Mycobacterium haemophilum]|uniref:Uncharacterized protein n=1 Tax=Mycobacterium haemophilum TaxID=29311 RepID=A0A0I9UJC7_9MYCO|nr:hypothetical protein ABH39_09455 [Mycobacterium haemophilum]KLO36180.1 hypothetical protein ABH38_13375 [Mycobacterium haemophilum]KLO42028.1 hypothetical protein ABH37_12005 [Mycobacterium haemophilum]KLO49939.1 hypothetical protein ABH36_09925 [Mycobacterium haemophilum]